MIAAQVVITAHRQRGRAEACEHVCIDNPVSKDVITTDESPDGTGKARGHIGVELDVDASEWPLEILNGPGA